MFFINNSGNSIPTGVPVKIKGKVIELDQQRPPKKFPVNKEVVPATLFNNRIDAGKPIEVEPGAKTIPFSIDKPDQAIPANGLSKPLIFPFPVPALTAQMTSNAINDIRYWGINQNLNTSSVWTMLLDSRGEFWLGTMGGGAVRFNGDQFEHFTEKEGLGSNHVFSLMEDSKGNIWIGTMDGGVSRIDGTHLTRFTAEEGLPHNFVLSIEEDSSGNLWFGTRGGLCRFDGTRMTPFTVEDGLLYNEVISIYEDSNQHLWFGTGEGTGLYRYDGEKLIHYNVGKGKGDNDVHAILEDRQGNMWFGTWGGGVVKYDGKHFVRYSEPQGLKSKNILSIIEDQDGHLWFGNLGGGVTEYDGHSFIHYTTDEGLSSNNVRFVLEDDQQNIWACTLDKGINRINKLGFRHISRDHGIKGSQVGTIIKDRGDNLWMTTDAGFSKFDGVQFTHYSSEQSIIHPGTITLMEDKDGLLWLAAGGGVSLFDGSSLIDFTRAEGLLAGDVRAIHQDRNGNIWFGTYAGGVIRYDGRSFIQYSENEGFISDDVYAIAEDQDGNLWFGTWGEGMASFDGNDFTFYTTLNGLGSNQINSIITDDYGSLWIGTGAGLERFDGDSFIGYSTSDGLINNMIFSLYSDPEKNIWIKTQKGLSLLLSSEIEKLNNKSRPDYQPQFISFGKDEGINESNLTPGKLIVHNDQLWVGAGNGIKVLDMQHNSWSFTPPTQVKLSNIEVNQSFIDYNSMLSSTSEVSINRSVDLKIIPFYNIPGELSLPHHSDHLTFHFSAIDWFAPHKIQYSYKIDGIDDDWSAPQYETKTDYRNLGHGEYKFWLKAKSISNQWSKPVSYAFTITPPWWHTWWAYLIYAVMLIAISYQIYRFLLSRQLAIEEGERLKEIDSLKSSIYTNITHEFRTPLTVINGMVEELEMDAPKETLKRTGIIRKQSNHLLQMVNQLLKLSKLEARKDTLNLMQDDIIVYLKYLVSSHESLAGAKRIVLEFKSDEESLFMDFDGKKLETILTNLISNAIKFTPEGGRILVNACKTTDDGNLLVIEVIDEGIGIAEKDLPKIFDRFQQVHTDHAYQGTGIGLALVKELVELMDGKIHVKSILNERTTFTIQLPVQNQSKLVERDDDSDKTVNVIPSKSQTLTSDQLHHESEAPILLIVEDNEDIVHYLSNSLMGLYQILVSRNGIEGVEKAFETVPDIIITDVMMPGMNGYELCEKLKKDERTNHIPIIILTARTTIEDKLEGLSMGADAYLPKPFEKKELLIRLDKLLELRKTLQRKTIEELKSRFEINEEHEVIKSSFVQKVEEEILSNLSNEDFTVTELAQSIYLSKSQLNRKLKAETGMSTTLFIRYVRLLEARKLLKNADSTVTEVVYQVGFNSPAYFSQAYKNEFGVNPSDEKK